MEVLVVADVTEDARVVVKVAQVLAKLIARTDVLVSVQQYVDHHVKVRAKLDVKDIALELVRENVNDTVEAIVV